jgi:hypothetical protein
MLIAACATRWPKDEVVKALGRLTLVCRGPKPIAALKEVGLAPALGVPEPNTWRDPLSELDRKLPVAGKRVAVQEYGARNEELLAGLPQRGARVTAVSVYGWVDGTALMVSVSGSRASPVCFRGARQRLGNRNRSVACTTGRGRRCSLVLPVPRYCAFPSS